MLFPPCCFGTTTTAATGASPVASRQSPVTEAAVESISQILTDMKAAPTLASVRRWIRTNDDVFGSLIWFLLLVGKGMPTMVGAAALLPEVDQLSFSGRKIFRPRERQGWTGCPNVGIQIGRPTFCDLLEGSEKQTSLPRQGQNTFLLKYTPLDLPNDRP